MFALHLGLMAFIAGDPFHLFRVVLGQIDRSFVGAGEQTVSAWYYFRYLFVDLQHVWIAGFLAAAGVVLALATCMKERASASGTTFIVFWLLCVLALLSFFPISFSPLRFAQKQSNYLTLFLAPLALLAGYALARLPLRSRTVALLLYVPAALILAALQQADYRGFVANSKAAVEFALGHPDARIAGTPNNDHVASSYAILLGQPRLEHAIVSYGELRREQDAFATNGQPAPVPVSYAIIDRQTIGWGRDAVSLDGPLRCWTPFATLVPAGIGSSARVIDALIVIARYLPAPASKPLTGRLRRLASPEPAKVYTVPADNPLCRDRQG